MLKDAKYILGFVVLSIFFTYFLLGSQSKDTETLLKNIEVRLSKNADTFHFSDVSPITAEKICLLNINISFPPNYTNEKLSAFLSADIGAIQNKIPSIIYKSKGSVIPVPEVQLAIFFISGGKAIDVFSFVRPFAIRDGERYPLYNNEEDKCYGFSKAIFEVHSENGRNLLMLK